VDKKVMRKLYLVSIIHMSADIGSLASALDETARSEFGQEAWQKHKEVISSFWDHIGRLFEAMEVRGFKVYQDGMVADEVEELRIINEGISQGSKNYEILGKLIERGAILMKTEDLALVKQEYAHIAKIARSKTPAEKETWTLRYKLAQKKLLRQRDDFIVQQIKDTLGEGETGILFIGAQHKILPKLPKDIEVVTVKGQI
jgi:hypothetical protein